MEKIDKILLTLAILIVIVFVLLYIFVLYRLNDNTFRKRIDIVDTTYNTITLDSIKYNIIIRDSIVYHIRHDYEDSITVVVNLDDSSSVVLFKQLTRERD